MNMQIANTYRVLSMGQAPLLVLTRISSFNDHSSYWLSHFADEESGDRERWQPAPAQRVQPRHRGSGWALTTACHSISR